ncbi:MAG TPA: hypothetical protein VMR74_05430 [Gammaproteobacteria bacterium]|nr:hypothetical protein [Gammaproteobacteria bacterium]
MRAKRICALTAAAMVVAPAVLAQPGYEIHGLNGAWERWPNRAAGLGSDATPPPEEIEVAPVPEPPLKADYLEPWRKEQAEVARLTEQGLPPANNYSACIADGMPTMMQGMFPMEVLETPGQITIIQEAYNQVRRIYFDEALPPPEQAEPLFHGHSVGRWEGDTLVVETVGIKDHVRFRDVPHSPSMRITERIRLVGDEFMVNEMTVTDPVYLTEPWTWSWAYRRFPDYRIQEYICENNLYYRDPELGYQRLRVE